MAERGLWTLGQGVARPRVTRIRQVEPSNRNRTRKKGGTMDVDAVYRREVFAISATEPLVEAARTMKAHDVSALVVLLGEDLLGIITERDLSGAMARGDVPERTTVIEYMTDQPVTVTPETGLREAAAVMFELDVRHLPVVVGPKVVGMLSARDLLATVVDAVSP
jgi:CBS domain-containing protein